MADKKQNRRNNRNDDDFNPRFRKMRKKVCPLCADKDLELDYKNAEQLRKFINDKGKILHYLYFVRNTDFFVHLIVFAFLLSFDM